MSSFSFSKRGGVAISGRSLIFSRQHCTGKATFSSTTHELYSCTITYNGGLCICASAFNKIQHDGNIGEFPVEITDAIFSSLGFDIACSLKFYCRVN